MTCPWLCSEVNGLGSLKPRVSELEREAKDLRQQYVPRPNR